VLSILTLTMNPTIDKATSADHVVPGRKLRCMSPRYEPGGGGINVSRAIQVLGGASVAVFPSGGPTGQLLRDLLEGEGIYHHAIPIEGWIRENLTVYEETTGQQYRFGMPGPPLVEEEWNRCLDELAKFNPKPDLIAASGSLPPGVPNDFYGRISRLARDWGSRMILDTSGEPLRLGVQEGIFLVKPNITEFNFLAGRELEGEAQQLELAQEIVSSGKSQVVVLSLGAAGTLAVWEEGHEHLRSPTVPVKSKVGAGDSMVAGIALGLAESLPLLEAVQFGTAAGAAAVMTPGTELCRREDVERLKREMTARK
jgi:6-phosphofructokinase 2